MAETKDQEKTAKPKKAAAKPKTAAPKAATAKKTATTAKKATTAKPAAKKSKSASITPEQRYRMVEVAAYYLAEKDSFAGSPVDYWIAAEIQISKG